MVVNRTSGQDECQHHPVSFSTSARSEQRRGHARSYLRSDLEKKQHRHTRNRLSPRTLGMDPRFHSGRYSIWLSFARGMLRMPLRGCVILVLIRSRVNEGRSRNFGSTSTVCRTSRNDTKALSSMVAKRLVIMWGVSATRTGAPFGG